MHASNLKVIKKSNVCFICSCQLGKAVRLKMHCWNKIQKLFKGDRKQGKVGPRNSIQSKSLNKVSLWSKLFKFYVLFIMGWLSYATLTNYPILSVLNKKDLFLIHNTCSTHDSWYSAGNFMSLSLQNPG